MPRVGQIWESDLARYDSGRLLGVGSSEIFLEPARSGLPGDIFSKISLESARSGLLGVGSSQISIGPAPRSQI